MRAARAGGLALVIGAVVFMGVFSFLAARFHYPEVLDGNAADVLPALLATGETGRLVWAIYALLPLLWIPAGVGAFEALRPRSEGSMRTAMLFALVSSLAMMAGLMRWPSLHWELAQTWAAVPSARPALEAVFNGANRYLGNYIGEFLGELAINGFFLLSALAMLKSDSGFPKWIAYFGLVATLGGGIAMFRNAVPAVMPVSDVNNYLLPIWMITFGLALIRYRSPAQP